MENIRIRDEIAEICTDKFSMYEYDYEKADQILNLEIEKKCLVCVNGKLLNETDCFVCDGTGKIIIKLGDLIEEWTT